MAPVHPLWKRDRRELLEEFIGLGFKARIGVVNEQKLSKNFLGKGHRGPDNYRDAGSGN
jgi:diphthamide synthase (EF-2-diphthine--ammonia ligase)